MINNYVCSRPVRRIGDPEPATPGHGEGNRSMALEKHAIPTPTCCPTVAGQR
ncbi:MAG: hypothetical protein KO206_05305 [Methanomicrobiaceae archaeon]|uniref:Uncharacterized protein n=1 Tax=hydrocarbon metagenome TaxID=938273 RepID=A0A0W8FHI1_9ZZZZ|nr:hypothetical protein [Methanomicrobiaceae archaeon]